MNRAHRSPRIAIVQSKMHWRCEENTIAILEDLAQAAEAGAHICVFPELAITGFHRLIKTEAEPLRVEHALRQIRVFCNEKSIACVVGTPTFTQDKPPFNSHIHINELGEIAAVSSKIGLTPTEASFFAAGSSRPIAYLHQTRCTSVLCREVEDLESISTQLTPGICDIIFWPSLIGHAPSNPPDPFEIDYLPMAQQLAKQSAAHLIQCNWPNSLNTPDSSYLGESAVISATGELLFKLPRNQAGMAIFMLGSDQYRWLAREPLKSNPAIAIE
ncbi:carbon-nitrogen hydrolase family protein [Iodobacter arcticus]|uniref:Carbon-nitrogen hydrolase family protein n=1 Tax=Iodobacter arcticus TaxID=590593 RepID=A0ABW2R298_9NEIS